ncbi:hypothetical protein LguiA_020799 [Lonicera macranthoides]
MADMAESSTIPYKNDKPVVLRVKRKAFQSPVEALWLEINERPVKRPLLDFENLSISDSSSKVEELKIKKVFVQHVETLSSLEVPLNVLQSFAQPESVKAVESDASSEEKRRFFKTENKQDMLLLKSKQKQEVLAKNARFEQIWNSRKGKKEAMHDEPLHEMCHLYDIVRVDDEETAINVQKLEEEELEDQRLMSSFLPLLREFIPSAAEEIETDIQDFVSKQVSKDDYVYDLYAVKDEIDIPQEDASNPFPLVQVDDDDGFYDGLDGSEYASDDSNAENNPLNEYPDEESSADDEEVESKTSTDESEEHESGSNKFSEPEDGGERDWLEDEVPLYGEEIYGNYDGGVYDDDDDEDNRKYTYP